MTDEQLAEIRTRVEKHTAGQAEAEQLLMAYYALQAEYDALQARMAVFQARDIEKARMIHSLRQVIDAAGLTPASTPAE